MRNFISKVRSDVVGATAIEYGLIAAAIAIVILVGAQTVGVNLKTTFNSIANAV